MHLPTPDSTILRRFAKPIVLNDLTTIQPSFSRRWEGPGLLLIVSKDPQGRTSADTSGAIPAYAFPEGRGVIAFESCGNLADRHPPVYDFDNAGNFMTWSRLWFFLNDAPSVAAVVAFGLSYDTRPGFPVMVRGIGKHRNPFLRRESEILHPAHIRRSPPRGNLRLTVPGHVNYEAVPAAVAHTRTLGFL
ncbi:hypothetical protein LZ554_009064 [Drepanopeziza brunnea f. sp. 'monogermtubi']|nr:hypothetical protein LZ554_009064 [Drepanopeziza brunnea f. sp. 'monogermtubi']